mmetsp:Transcript_48981/g.97741  ORF Transcript_48981/g.97741 Transcript_48981/m.97741 type:complete len:200 (-) Transcript_48981:705-1304(-)
MLLGTTSASPVDRERCGLFLKPRRLKAQALDDLTFESNDIEVILDRDVTEDGATDGRGGAIQRRVHSCAVGVTVKRLPCFDSLANRPSHLCRAAVGNNLALLEAKLVFGRACVKSHGHPTGCRLAAAWAVRGAASHRSEIVGAHSELQHGRLLALGPLGPVLLRQLGEEDKLRSGPHNHRSICRHIDGRHRPRHPIQHA